MGSSCAASCKGPVFGTSFSNLKKQGTELPFCSSVMGGENDGYDTLVVKDDVESLVRTLEPAVVFSVTCVCISSSRKSSKW